MRRLQINAVQPADSERQHKLDEAIYTVEDIRQRQLEAVEKTHCRGVEDAYLYLSQCAFDIAS